MKSKEQIKHKQLQRKVVLLTRKWVAFIEHVQKTKEFAGEVKSLGHNLVMYQDIIDNLDEIKYEQQIPELIRTIEKLMK